MVVADAAGALFLILGIPVCESLVRCAGSCHQGQDPTADGYDAAYNAQCPIKRFGLFLALSKLGREYMSPLWFLVIAAEQIVEHDNALLKANMWFDFWI